VQFLEWSPFMPMHAFLHAPLTATQLSFFCSAWHDKNTSGFLPAIVSKLGNQLTEAQDQRTFTFWYFLPHTPPICSVTDF
jgi:hypothetical protein